MRMQFPTVDVSKVSTKALLSRAKSAHSSEAGGASVSKRDRSASGVPFPVPSEPPPVVKPSPGPTNAAAIASAALTGGPMIPFPEPPVRSAKDAAKKSAKSGSGTSDFPAPPDPSLLRRSKTASSAAGSAGSGMSAFPPVNMDIAAAKLAAVKAKTAKASAHKTPGRHKDGGGGADGEDLDGEDLDGADISESPGDGARTGSGRNLNHVLGVLDDIVGMDEDGDGDGDASAE